MPRDRRPGVPALGTLTCLAPVLCPVACSGDPPGGSPSFAGGAGHGSSAAGAGMGGVSGATSGNAGAGGRGSAGTTPVAGSGGAAAGTGGSAGMLPAAGGGGSSGSAPSAGAGSGGALGASGGTSGASGTGGGAGAPAAGAGGKTGGGEPELVEEISIADVWSGHPVFFALVTHGTRQYAAFYDADRNMSVASRELGATSFEIVKLASVLGWDSHNYVAMAVDTAGSVHVSGNMHAVPLVYFRTGTAGDTSTFQKLAMVGSNESSVTYPVFFTGPTGNLVFEYRDGESGSGNTIFNAYDPGTAKWSRVLNSSLLDGQGQRNAYPEGPVLGPDGYFHATLGGNVTLILDPESLHATETIAPALTPYPSRLDTPVSKQSGMHVRWASDGGVSPEPNLRYLLRWETLDSNGDQPRSTIPPATPLVLYGFRQWRCSPA